MRAEVVNIVDEIKRSLSLIRGHLDWDRAIGRIADLELQSQAPDFWEEAQKAQAIMKEKTQLEKATGSVTAYEEEMAETVDLIELGEEEGDESIIKEGMQSLEALQKIVAKHELESLLSGEADGNDAYLEINAGAGGTEAQDWAEILLRLYNRWAEKRKFKLQTIELSTGDEAGIKSATLLVKGPNAYGWLKTESGIHRLVRISPFDSNARRHTSFASVWVYPVIDDSIELEIEEKDLRIDTYRASGAGGQHVNTTDSAVRITHIPTNIVVQCQNDRSQHRNKATAMDMLRSRLYEHELKLKEAKINEEHSAKTEIGWGHQIRSYVLHPYQMVKDLRTNVETGNTQAVLDGEIDMFLEASLSQKVMGKK